MKSVISFLKGKKTYLVMSIGLLLKAIDFAYSDIGFIEFVTSTEFIDILKLLGIGTLRAGISSAVK